MNQEQLHGPAITSGAEFMAGFMQAGFSSIKAQNADMRLMINIREKTETRGWSGKNPTLARARMIR